MIYRMKVSFVFVKKTEGFEKGDTNVITKNFYGQTKTECDRKAQGFVATEISKGWELWSSTVITSEEV